MAKSHFEAETLRETDYHDGYRVFVRTLSGLIILTCLVCAAFIYFFRVGIRQTYFPEASNLRDLYRIALLIAVAVYFGCAIWWGQLIWFLGARFSVRRLLVTIFVLGLILGISTPAVRWLLRMESARQNVQNSLDHIAIRDAAREFLDQSNVSDTKIDEIIEMPDLIARTSPSFLKIDDGNLIIEYGDGHGHFGLVVVPAGHEIPYGEQIAEGIAYYEFE